MHIVRIVVIVAAIILAGGPLEAQQSAEGVSSLPKPVVMYFFWGAGCPHCKKERAFLDELARTHPSLDIKAFETQNNPRHAKLYVLMTAAYGVKPLGVPGTFLGDRAWIGFNERIADQIENEARRCVSAGCIDPLDRLRSQEPPGKTVEHAPSLSTLNPVCVHAFLHPDCPQCNRVRPLLVQAAELHNVDVTMHDVADTSQREIFDRFRQRYNVTLSSFPSVFIGDRILIGASAIKGNLKREIEFCTKRGCPCPTEHMQGLSPYPPRPQDVTLGGDGTVELPFIGSVNLADFSLPAFTIILGGLDGFNPCAFFVLFVLLGMLIHARSRRRMLLIGGTFVFFSGAIYFLFMAAWLNLFILIGAVRYVTYAAAAIALIIGLVNIKDYFFFRRGVSLTIPEAAKPRLFDRMRTLLRAESTASMLAGTIVLAVVANTYELLCTAGFPMIFTRLITLHDLTSLGRYGYLVLYNAVYVLPLMAIVMIFVVTLGARKLKESEGRALKLVSGLMMFALGLVLAIKPELLGNAVAAAALLAGVVLAAVVVMLVAHIVRRGRPQTANADGSSD